MTTATSGSVGATPLNPSGKSRTGKASAKSTSPQWRYTLAVLVIAVVVLIPVFVTVMLAFRPQLQPTSHSFFTLENFSYVFSQTQILTWLRNSLTVTLATVLVAILVAAPAGYVLSRSRSKAVSGYALLLFIAQSFPQIVSIVPLFVLFAKFNLDDNLLGLAIVYVGVDDIGGDVDDGGLLRHDSRRAGGSVVDRRLFAVRGLRQDCPAQLAARRAVHRYLRLPPGLE